MYLLYFHRGDIPLRVRATGGHSPSYIFGIKNIIILSCNEAIGGYYIVTSPYTSFPMFTEDYRGIHKIAFFFFFILLRISLIHTVFFWTCAVGMTQFDAL